MEVIVDTTKGVYKERIVRCKNCIYGKIREVDGKKQVYCDYQFDWWNMDGFCSYGEARDE